MITNWFGDEEHVELGVIEFNLFFSRFVPKVCDIPRVYISELCDATVDLVLKHLCRRLESFNYINLGFVNLLRLGDSGV